jgi:Homeodomain-like domain
MNGATEAIKPDKIRQLSIEQLNAIDHLLQGKSDRATAEAVGVSRQTVWVWRKRDILYIAELYVFSLINRPPDVVFVEYLDIAILEAKSIASGLCDLS